MLEQGKYEACRLRNYVSKLGQYLSKSEGASAFLLRHSGRVFYVAPWLSRLSGVTMTVARLARRVRATRKGAPALSTEVDRTLENGNNLILDLSQATFIDSSVVHVLVQASRAANGNGRAVVLQLGTAAIVERVLEIAEIERVLPRAHERQEAVRMIQQQAETV